MKTKTAIIPLAVIVVLAAAMMVWTAPGVAHAEFSDDVYTKAYDGHEIWKDIEQLQQIVNKTPEDEKKLQSLEEEFGEIKVSLNILGIATPEQWDSDPDYWRSQNMPEITYEQNHTSGMSSDISSDSMVTGSLGGGSTIPGHFEVMTHCMCTGQGLSFIAGFDYYLWGFWKTSAWASSWKTLTYVGDYDESTVTLRKDHDRIRPFTALHLKSVGSASGEITMSGEDSSGNEIYHDGTRTFTITTRTITSVNSFVHGDWFYNADQGDRFTSDTELTALN